MPITKGESATALSVAQLTVTPRVTVDSASAERNLLAASPKSPVVNHEPALIEMLLNLAVSINHEKNSNGIRRTTVVGKAQSNPRFSCPR